MTPDTADAPDDAIEMAELMVAAAIDLGLSAVSTESKRVTVSVDLQTGDATVTVDDAVAEFAGEDVMARAAEMASDEQGPDDETE